MVYINGLCHMTKMVTMAINSTNLKKILVPQNWKAFDLKLGMKHQGIWLCKVGINHDPGMTLTYFTARLT